MTPAEKFEVRRVAEIAAATTLRDRMKEVGLGPAIEEMDPVKRAWTRKLLRDALKVYIDSLEAIPITAATKAVVEEITEGARKAIIS